MFNVVVARSSGDHIAPEQRRYDTPNASSIGQPLRLHVNVPDPSRSGSNRVCHRQERGQNFFHLARFHGMPPRADPLGRSSGSPDGVAERSTGYRSSKDWLRPSAGRSLLALYGIAFEEQRLADECRNRGFLIRLGNQECRLRPFAGEKAFRICGNKDHRDLECGE